MAKLQFSSMALLLLQAVAALAAPNVAPTRPQPALGVLGASTLASATASAAQVSAPTVLLEGQQFQGDLKKRASSESVEAAGSSIVVANSFTSGNMTSTMAGTAIATSSSSGGGVMAVGAFTGADGGVYSVTSQSGYVVIDGKTLGVGQGALIGNEQVSEGSGGLIANGYTVKLSIVTTSAGIATTEAEVSSSSSAASSTASSSSSAAASTTASATSSAASSASAASASSSKAAAPTHAAGGFLAVAGGLVGLLLV